MPIPGVNLTDDQLYNALNVVLPCWVMLAIIPTHKATQAAVMLACFFVSIMYVGLIIPLVLDTKSPDHLSFAEMMHFDGVRKVLSHPKVQLGAWAHYIAFDLWTGQWIAQDAHRRRMPRLLVAPILFCTFMLGPTGMALYFILRTPFKLPRGASRPHVE